VFLYKFTSLRDDTNALLAFADPNSQHFPNSAFSASLIQSKVQVLSNCACINKPKEPELKEILSINRPIRCIIDAQKG